MPRWCCIAAGGTLRWRTTSRTRKRHSSECAGSNSSASQSSQQHSLVTQGWPRYALRVTVQLIHDVERLSEYWWLVLLRGLLALGFAAAIWIATGVLDFHYGSAIALVFIQACFGSYLLIE